MGRTDDPPSLPSDDFAGLEAEGTRWSSNTIVAYPSDAETQLYEVVEPEPLDDPDEPSKVTSPSWDDYVRMHAVERERWMLLAIVIATLVSVTLGTWIVILWVTM